MLLAKKSAEVVTNGVRFVFDRERNKIETFDAEKTLNYICSWTPAREIKSREDLEIEVSFWLRENNVI